MEVLKGLRSFFCSSKFFNFSKCSTVSIVFYTVKKPNKLNKLSKPHTRGPTSCRNMTMPPKTATFLPCVYFSYILKVTLYAIYFQIRGGCYFFEFRDPPNLIIEGCRKPFKKKWSISNKKKTLPKRITFLFLVLRNKKKKIVC